MILTKKSIIEGQTAPDFSLPEASGKMITLSEELKKGPVIIAFYPTDWGIVCTLEMKTFRTMISELNQAGVELIGISVNSPSSHRSWKEQLDIKFPLLSDQEGKVSASYGVLRENVDMLAGHDDRAIFIVDRNRKVIYAWIAKDPSIQPDYTRIGELARSHAY